MPWFVKLEEGLVDKAQFDAVVPLHLAWLAELEAQGHRPVSGYWADRRGAEGAGGMLLFWAGSWDEASRLVRHDPLIEQGCVSWTLHEWAPVFGVPAPVSPPATAAASGMKQQHQS
ncbi:YciI family protein [Cyanobium sp. LEGE 06113]|uniref:YciI family protein n=1 Tax=Cyanobium sp. LEGE 06113 TaxID=1297573 RepID=UPI00187EBD55|nr:YciI family protein [Cyanobium sp. LEGE 06113]MBE9152650.1 hypothetical protein [Cyanobium sp. LEGE 06113]MBE9153145.1 hypothetical protein [Cyanobium sp. LEGE 06113]